MIRAVGILACVLPILVVTAAASGQRQSVMGRELTSYGATRKAWAAHHVADPNPKLIRGCCFLPKQRDGLDRYYAVMYDERARVFNYEMDFAPRISATVARRLMRKEVPPDARLIKRVRKTTCEQLIYRSRMLKTALGSRTVGIEFSATGVGGRYRGVVGDVLVGPLSTDDAC